MPILVLNVVLVSYSPKPSCCGPWNVRSGQDSRSFGPRNAYGRIGGPRNCVPSYFNPWSYVHITTHTTFVCLWFSRKQVLWTRHLCAANHRCTHILPLPQETLTTYTHDYILTNVNERQVISVKEGSGSLEWKGTLRGIAGQLKGPEKLITRPTWLTKALLEAIVYNIMLVLDCSITPWCNPHSDMFTTYNIR